MPSIEANGSLCQDDQGVLKAVLLHNEKKRVRDMSEEMKTSRRRICTLESELHQELLKVGKSITYSIDGTDHKYTLKHVLRCDEITSATTTNPSDEEE